MIDKVLDFIVHWWTVLRHMPICKCPFCKGHGGDTGHEGEWYECYWCYEHWNPVVDYGHEWAWGRVSPFRWVNLMWEWWTGHKTVDGFVKCRLGFHEWSEHGYCYRCFKVREERSKG
jgi:hypothetical protein